MSFDFEISASADDALRAEKEVVSGLAQIMGQAKQTGAAVEAAFKAPALRDASGRFLATGVAAAALRERVQQASSAAEAFNARLRANAIHAELTAANQRDLASSMGGVAQALREQESMLERIRGPMRQLENEQALLNSMFQRGVITAREYSREVGNLRQQMARAGGGRGGGVGEGIANGLGLGVAAGGAAGIAAVAVQKGVELGKELADTYTNLSNRLKQVSTDEEHHASLMEKTHQLANTIRADWAATGETFVRLRNATRDLGLTETRTLALTETIGKAFAMSGASASEASSGMLQLTQALAAGALQGDEFRSIAENVPIVMDLLAKQLGVTRGELKKLGSEGKISADVIVAAFENAKDDIDKGFAKSAPTLSQQWAVFKNDMVAAFGPLVNDFLPWVSSAVKKLVDELTGVAGVISDIKGAVSSVPGSSSAGSALGSLFSYANTAFNPVKQIQKIGDGIDSLKRRVDGDAGGKKWFEIYVGSKEELNAVTDEMQRMFKLAEDLSRLRPLAVAEPDAWSNTASKATEARDAIQQVGEALGIAEKQGGSWTSGTLMVDRALGLITVDAPRAAAEMIVMQKTVENLGDKLLDFGGTALGIFKQDLPDAIEDTDRMAKLAAETIGGLISDVSADLPKLMHEGMRFLLTGSLGGWGMSDEDIRKKLRGGSKRASKFNDPWKEAGNSVAPDSIAAKISAVADSLRAYIDEAEKATSVTDSFIAVLEKANQSAGWDQLRDEFTTTGTHISIDQGDVVKQLASAITSAANTSVDLKGVLTDIGLLDPWQPHIKSLKEVNDLTRKWNEQLAKMHKDAGGEIVGGLKDGLVKIREEIFDIRTLVAGSLVEAFHSLENAALDFFSGVDVEWDKIGEKILRDLTQIAIRMLLMSAITGLGGGNLLQGVAFGGKHDDGGSYVVGGSGGRDSQYVMMALTPGERVDVTPRGKQGGGHGGGAVHVHNHYDRRELLEALETPEGDRVIHNFIRRNPGAVRSVLGR